MQGAIKLRFGRWTLRQVGLLVAENSTPNLPMDIVVANELEIIGSHGIQAYRYPELMEMIAAGRLARAA